MATPWKAELGYQWVSRANPWMLGCRYGHSMRLVTSLSSPATEQALETLPLSGTLTLVLEEDGTAVESEDFFQLLEDDTYLMVLESGQNWSPLRVRPTSPL